LQKAIGLKSLSLAPMHAIRDRAHVFRTQRTASSIPSRKRSARPRLTHLGAFHIDVFRNIGVDTRVKVLYLIYSRLMTENAVSLPIQPNLEPGKAYRTREFSRFCANPARLARRLVREGKLLPAAHGLFYTPTKSRFGQAPPSEEQILRGFLGNSPFVITGPLKWNALGLGSTTMFAATMVYNKKRTGEFIFDGRRFLLRRVYFPEHPTPEWYVIDLLKHHDMAGVSLVELEDRLVASLREGRWERTRLRAMAEQYGTRTTLELVERALRKAGETR